MAPQRPRSVAIYRRPDNRRAGPWEKRIRIWLKRHAPDIGITTANPDLVIALGGDGTILEATRQWPNHDYLLMGLNLGTVGFLASARAEKDFLPALKKVLAGKHRTAPRMLLTATLRRKDKVLHTTTAFNEISLQGLTGLVGIRVQVGGYRVQHIRGSGVMVATPTGSTGYNLSAHGPLVDPTLHCMIITEILDYSFPTPSIVVPPDRPITLRITDVRQKSLLRLQGHSANVDVLMYADAQPPIPLLQHDEITIAKSERNVHMVELKPNYFYESIHEKFSLT